MSFGILFVPFRFFFVSDVIATFIPSIFISCTSSDSLFPVDLTFHGATFSVSCTPSLFPFSCQVFCHLICQYPRLCIFAYEYFVFLGRVTNPSTKPPFLEDQFVSWSGLSLTACLAWEALPGTESSCQHSP